MEGCPFTGTCMVGTRVGLLVGMPAARDITPVTRYMCTRTSVLTTLVKGPKCNYTTLLTRFTCAGKATNKIHEYLY